MLISSRVVVEGAASGSEGCNKRVCGGDYSRLMVVKKSIGALRSTVCNMLCAGALVSL